MDLLFVDLPRDFRFPVSEWCLGYRYMISCLRREGFSAELLHPVNRDARRRLLDSILRAEPAMVGFTTYDVQLPATLGFIQELRDSGLKSHIVLGGLCASAIPEYLLSNAPAVDSVVIGEGEQTIVDLARYVVRGQGRLPISGVCLRDGDGPHRGEARPLIGDLDALPEPAFDDLRTPSGDAPIYRINRCAPVIGSRGCYGRCTFCSIQKFYRSQPGRIWRGRGAASVADDIATVSGLTGLDRITFMDENFMGPGAAGKRHAIDIADEIRRRGFNIRFNFGCRPNDVDLPTMECLKEAGLAGVTLGIESMSPSSLQLFNKLTSPEVNYRALEVLEALEINTEITFIFFHPLSTLEDICDNLRFVEYVNRSRYAYFSRNQPFSEFVPFFGTDLTDRFAAAGLAHRDLHGFSTEYADPRVAFLASRILAVPVDLLSRLRYHLPVRGPDHLMEIGALIGDYEIYLNKVRLPTLLADMCDLLERGESASSDGIRAAAAQLDTETAKIHSLLDAFLANAA